MNQLCWCGNSDLKEFSPGYLRCDVCSTLISKSFPSTDITAINDEEVDFYGKKYWLDHQVKELGLPSIGQRSRSDLLDRCGLWLDQLLEFSLPPARLLEIGCSHGGFLALAELAGFRVTGNELCQWVVEFARKNLGVNVLTGPIERLDIQPGSFDIICMFDVLEHLQNPVRTLLCCAQALTPNGIILLQTPQYPVPIGFAALQESQHPFLKVMLPDEHLFLFSAESVKRLFSAAGFSAWEFVPAPFAHYDMMLAAGRGPLPKNSARAISEALEMSPGGRVAQGFLTMAKGYRSREQEEEIRTLRGYLEQESASSKAYILKLEEEIRTLRGYLEQGSASSKANILKQEEEIRTLRGYLEQESTSGKAHTSKQEMEIRILRGRLEQESASAKAKQDLDREKRQRTLLVRLGEKLIDFGKRREK
jgi:2-polyprenyl-3-methyl-5-hydroxy-6-metoxy-1,4-benzoquinol methylase